MRKLIFIILSVLLVSCSTSNSSSSLAGAPVGACADFEFYNTWGYHEKIVGTYSVGTAVPNYTHYLEFNADCSGRYYYVNKMTGVESYDTKFTWESPRGDQMRINVTEIAPEIIPNPYAAKSLGSQILLNQYSVTLVTFAFKPNMYALDAVKE